MSWASDVTLCEQTLISHPCADSRTPFPFASNQHWGLCSLSLHIQHTERNTAYSYTDVWLPHVKTRLATFLFKHGIPEFRQNRFYRMCHILIIINGANYCSDLKKHNVFSSHSKV